MLTRLPLSKSFVLALFISAITVLNFSAAEAQGPGINSAGRDFYIGYMPGIPHAATFIQGPRELLYALIGSFTDNNSVTISYFADDGTELGGANLKLSKGQVIEQPLDQSHMSPSRPGETPEYRGAHIKSKFPITVQTLQEGSSTGGMTQAIPTSALGKNYVIASWFDNPLQDNPGFLNRDSSSSEFLILATQDNTTVTYTPNATTYSGIIGMNTGRGATGRPHPTTITLRRGQTFWVRAQSTDATEDLTGSTVVSDKPIVVLAGQERALLGDPSGVWATLDNDIRDVMVEQMIPVDSWGTDYPSIPFMPPPEVTRLLQNGAGDMYRAMTDDPSGGYVDMWDGTLPFYRQLGMYQSPAAEWDNLEHSEDFVVRPASDGTPKKAYIVMYDYFQGQHDFSPGSTAKNGKGGTPQSGGGKKIADEVTYTCPNEMNVVPIDKYQLSTVFQIPSNSHYRGFQFFNIILNKDSVSKVKVLFNGVTTKPLSAYNTQKRYSIPRHPELVGLTYQPGPGNYMIYGNTPFACYSYGRTQTEYKDGWGYAAPCGQVYGSQNEKQKPRAVITPSCDHWDVRITDSRPNDEGLADVMLLNDPDGFIVHPAYVSYNVSMQPSDYIVNPGDSVATFTIHINDYTKDAFAAIYAVDRAGNDTVFTLNYKAQHITLSSQSKDFGKLPVGSNPCTTFTVKVLATGASDTMSIGPLVPTRGDKAFSISSVPVLPKALHVGDSVVYTVCYNVSDILSHKDSLTFTFGCLDSNIVVRGEGVTPIIYASDWNFGAVAVGDSVCHLINVKNTGNSDLVLDSSWIFHNTTKEFRFRDAARIPIVIAPDKSVDLNFCFVPDTIGGAVCRMDWGTNLRPPFLHLDKDTSQLLGFGVKPGLNWDRPNQGYTVVCDSIQVVRITLENPSGGSATVKAENVSDVGIKGPDKAEFSIIANQLNYAPIEGKSWPLAVDATVWVDVQFKPDLTKGFGKRTATLYATGTNGNNPEVLLTAVIKHAVLAVSPSNYDFGIQKPGTVLTQTFMLHNTGDTDAVIQSLPALTGDYQIVSGPTVGDHLKAGDSVAIVVQWTAPADGPSTTTETVASNTPDCTPPQTFGAEGAAANILVAGTGHDFKLTYQCQFGTGTVVAKNVGLTNAVLDSLHIENGPTHLDANEFAFKSGGQKLLGLNQQMLGKTSTSFDVVFTPTHTGRAVADVVYFFHDPSKTPATLLVRVDSLEGFGYLAKNVLSLKPHGGAAFYTATTTDLVTVPVQLTQTFSDSAQVYGVRFTIRYMRDQFVFQPGKTDIGGLHQISIDGPKDDPTNTDYEYISFDLRSDNAIHSLDTIAHLTWEYVVAKDSNTQFQIKDVAFLDHAGNPACWIQYDSLPGEFYGMNVCGNYTLRKFLREGANFHFDRISPNPVSNITHVGYSLLKANTPVTMEVLNALGEKVMTLMKDEVHAAGAFEALVDASSLRNGVYTIRVVTPGATATRSMVVTK